MELSPRPPSALVWLHFHQWHHHQFVCLLLISARYLISHSTCILWHKPHHFHYTDQKSKCQCCCVVCSRLKNVGVEAELVDQNHLTDTQVLPLLLHAFELLGFLGSFKVRGQRKAPELALLFLGWVCVFADAVFGSITKKISKPVNGSLRPISG